MSNFYEYMNKMNHPESIAMDAQVMRYHPDPEHSPCYAKTEESCPIFRAAKKADNADDLEGDKPLNTEAHNLSEIMDILNDPKVQAAVPEIANATFSQFEEAYADVEDQYKNLEASMDDNYTKGTRAIRDKIFQEHPKDDYHSFGVDGHDRQDELEGLNSWGVTFHTSQMDDPSHKTYLDDAKYDKKVEMLRRVCGSKEFQVGIFQGKPEISSTCDDVKKAVAQMVMFNQCGIYNYKYGKTIYNLTYREDMNPGLERGKEHID